MNGRVRRRVLRDRPGTPFRAGVLGFSLGAVAATVACNEWGRRQHSAHDYDLLGALLFCAPPGALAGAFAGAKLGAARWRDVRIRR